MFRFWRLKKIHARFLESCRNLKEGRAYWNQATGFRRWFLELVSPIPLLGLHEEGQRLLSALQWLEAHNRDQAVRESVIREYHRMVYEGGGGLPAEYREGRISVVGSAIPRPYPEKVPALMKLLDLKLIEQQKSFDAAESVNQSAVLAAGVDLYQRIGLIHPFVDGNGRVARLAMNHLLRRYRMGFVIFPPLSESPELMAALQDAHAGRLEAILKLAKSCTLHT